MEFQEVVKRRKMVRSFKNKPVSKDIIDQILKNMFSGPSAGFSQGIEVVVLNTKEKRELFYQQYGSREEREKNFRWPLLENAPVMIIVCSHKQTYLDRYAEPDKGQTDKNEADWPVPYWHIDAGMAALLGLLTVVDHELGAVLTSCGDLDYVRNEFGIPSAYTPIGVISIGYPTEHDPPSPSLKRGRRDLDEVVHYNSWD